MIILSVTEKFNLTLPYRKVVWIVIRINSSNSMISEIHNYTSLFAGGLIEALHENMSV